MWTMNTRYTHLLWTKARKVVDMVTLIRHRLHHCHGDMDRPTTDSYSIGKGRLQEAFQIQFYACANDSCIMGVHTALGIIVT